jgi:hypothetical protein
MVREWHIVINVRRKQTGQIAREDRTMTAHEQLERRYKQGIQTLEEQAARGLREDRPGGCAGAKPAQRPTSWEE